MLTGRGDGSRYDLLCTEGLIRALRVFNGLEATPEFRLAAPAAGEPLQMKVLPETAQIRPFVVCAVLRNVRLDAQSYQSFIDLQEKLHQNICRYVRLVHVCRALVLIRRRPSPHSPIR